MTKDRAIEIVNNYDMFEEGEPDISTERLLQQTADLSNCDVSEVVEALIKIKTK